MLRSYPDYGEKLLYSGWELVGENYGLDQYRTSGGQSLLQAAWSRVACWWGLLPSSTSTTLAGSHLIGNCNHTTSWAVSNPRGPGIATSVCSLPQFSLEVRLPTPPMEAEYMYRARQHTSQGPEGTGWCGCQTPLHHIWKVMAIRWTSLVTEKRQTSLPFLGKEERKTQGTTGHWASCLFLEKSWRGSSWKRH